jgi:antitoxin component YwqK of YwqJK toxin-antitoxin module
MSLEIVYDEDGIYGDAKLFNDEGNITSQGKYKGKLKIDTWTYFNGKEQVLATEEFVDGKTHGTYKVFYTNGALAEVLNWQNGEKHGEWLKFFDNGAPLLKATYLDNKLQGKYLYYFKNGQLEIEANYKNDQEDGKWTFYLADGKVNYVLKYDNGRLLNPQVLDEKRAKEQKEFEHKKDSLKDPEKMRNNPDMYMRGY